MRKSLISHPAALALSVLTLTACQVVAPSQDADARPGVGNQDTASPSGATRNVLITKNAGWTRYSNPNVLSTPKGTYFGSVTSSGSVQATRLDTGTGKVQRVTLAYRFNQDDHAAPTFTRLPNGKIAAFWSGHGTSPVYYRVSKSEDTIIGMGPTKQLEGSGMEDEKTTYTVVYQMRGEKNRYWLFTRLQKDKSWHLTTSKDLVTWTPNVRINTFPYDWKTEKTWPYMRSVSTGWRTIDFVFTDKSPRYDNNPSLHHFRYRAGRFERSDGSLIATMSQVQNGRPIDDREGTLLYDGSKGSTAGAGIPRIYSVTRSKYGRLNVGWTTEANTNADLTVGDYTHRRFYFSPWTKKWSQTILTRNSDVYPAGMDAGYGNTRNMYVIDRDTASKGRIVRFTDRGQGTLGSMVLASGENYRAVNTPQSVDGADHSPSTGPVEIIYQRGRWTSWKDYDTDLMARTRGWVPRNINAAAADGAVRIKVREGINGPLLAWHSGVVTFGSGSRTEQATFTTKADGQTTVQVPSWADWYATKSLPSGDWGLFSTPRRQLP